MQVDLRKSNLDIHPVTKHNAIKRNFLGRSEYARGTAGLQEAVDKRPVDILAKRDTHLKNLTPPGVNIYTQHKLNSKWKPNVPIHVQDDPLYDAVEPEELDAIKSEGKQRKVLKREIVHAKKDASLRAVKRKIEETGEGDGDLI